MKYKRLNHGGVEMRSRKFITGLIVIITIGISIGLMVAKYIISAHMENAMMGVIAFMIALTASLSIKFANGWERVVISRFGTFRSINGPRLFFMIPIIDRLAYRTGTRIITSSFAAEKTLSKDLAGLNVNAGRFWIVTGSQRGAVEVTNYQRAMSCASPTASHDVIGKTLHADMLVGRDKMNQELWTMIEKPTGSWLPSAN